MINILIIHQNFPGQYTHIVNKLSRDKNYRIVGLGINKIKKTLPKNVQYFQYAIKRGNTKGIHQWSQDIETKIIRGEACASGANELKRKGFKPDIICGHPGWGEMLFIKEVWPDIPILTYQEFYYNSYGFDYNFDKEFKGEQDWKDSAGIRAKTANQLMNLQTSDWAVTPTNFQRSSYPENWRNKISVIHDGINTQKLKPNSELKSLEVIDGVKINSSEKIITFINRTLEPYRGCHTFIRSIPKIQEKNPDAKIIIVGKNEGVSYGAKSRSGKEWKEVFLDEIKGNYNPKNVVFTGQIEYNKFIRLMQISKAHVYLTYPFVLSWSLLEAMSCGCPIVGSRTKPVEEVINDGENGILVDFFNPSGLADAIDYMLKNPEHAKTMGQRARRDIEANYELERCVSKHINLINAVIDGTLSN